MAQSQPKPKIISQKSPNQLITLYHGLGEIINKEEDIIEGESLIQIVWYPFPRIIINFTYNGEHVIEAENIKLRLAKLIPQCQVKINLHKRTYYGTKKTELIGYLTEPFKKGITDKLFSLTFHITNFFWFNISNYYDYDYDDEGNEKEIERQSWLMFFGQFIFDYGDWHIVLANLDETGELEEKLDTQGGYAVTHVCKIERLDGAQFALDEGYKIIDAFIYYLSFVRGFWIAPLLISGFDIEGNQILEEWRTPTIKADSWQSVDYSWTTSDTTEIVDTFSGFMKKWQDEVWKEVIQNSIQWYIESFKNTTEYNTSIILVQAALEKLSWTYLKNSGCVTSDGFNGLKASGQIRLLLKFIDINITPIDNNYPRIHSIAKELNWTDSIQAITEVRNAIIHPQIKGNRSQLSSKEILIEAFSISHGYLLECLLKLFRNS